MVGFKFWGLGLIRLRIGFRAQGYADLTIGI